MSLTPEEELELRQLEDAEKSHTLKTLNDTLADIGSQAFKPFRRAVEVYEEERKEGLDTMGKAFTDPGWGRTPLRLAIGGLQYIFSPIAAVAKGMVGEPIEEAAVGAGIPKKAAEFIGKLGEEAVYFIPPGGTIKSVMMKGQSGLKAAEEIGLKNYKSFIKDMEGFDGIKLPPEAKQAVSPIRQAIDNAVPPPLETEGPLKSITKPKVKEGIVDDITTASVSALKGDFDTSQRIFKQIGEKLALGEIEVKFIPEILKKHDITPVQFAKMYEQTVSGSGRVLAYHSRAKKEIMEALSDSPEALKILDEAFKSQPVTMVDRVLDGYASLENFRRSMLVGQVATTMRNIWSQNGRVSLSALDESLQGVIRGTVGGEGDTLRQAGEGLNVVVSAINQLKPEKRELIMKVLDADNGALSKARLFSQPVHEVALGSQVSQIVNTLNRTQEMHFRRLGFEAKMRQLLSRDGKKLETVEPSQIPEEYFAESANYALEMTFAASPKSKAAQEFVKMWTRFPLLTTINPFPRFNFANAIPFLKDHSPLGYLNAVKPSTLKALANGEPEEFAKAASRATIGSLMLDSAMHLRQSDYAGERWYEVKTGTDPKTGEATVWDTRAFAPFSTYLFLAEAFVHPERLKPSDFAQAFVGLNRVAGTGLVALDWLRASSADSFEKQVKSYVGQYAASFTVPGRSVKDFYSAFDPEENIYRDYKENPLLAPTLLNLPRVSQMVPESQSPVKSERMRSGMPVEIGSYKMGSGSFRQLTGLSRRTKTEVEQEIGKVGIEWTNIIPKSGIPKADRMLSMFMGKEVEKELPVLLATEGYKRLPVEAKRIYLKEYFGQKRRQAQKELMVKDPMLHAQAFWHRQDGDMKELIKKYIEMQ